MSTEAWMVVGLGVAGIAAQAIAAYLVVRVATAVLEERLNGHRELTRLKFSEHDRRLNNHEGRISALESMEG